MKNWESYKDNFLDFIVDHASINAKTGAVTVCGPAKCMECLFNDAKTPCKERKRIWLMEEVESFFVPQKHQEDLLRYLFRIGYRYIAKDYNGKAYIFKVKPRLSANEVWVVENPSDWDVLEFASDDLAFISSNDSEPLDIKKTLLKYFGEKRNGKNED